MTIFEQELALLAFETELKRLPHFEEVEFNLFDVFGVHREEQASSVLAYLFNMNDSLSFKDEFRRTFIKEFINKDKVPENAFQCKWKVTPELHVSGDDEEKSHRPDIVLESFPEDSTGMVVFIENKIRSGSLRVKQVKDTCHVILQRAQLHGWASKRLVYLLISPSNKERQDIKDEIEKVKQEWPGDIYWIEWRAVGALCEKFIPDAKANSRLKHVLVDFVKYIERMEGEGYGEE